MQIMEMAGKELNFKIELVEVIIKKNKNLISGRK